MKLFAPIALFLTLSTTALTQTAPKIFTDPANLSGERVSPRDGRELPIDQGASGLQQLLRKLSTRASVMNIVAHPDDEDGGMLTLYSRGLGARVADLSLNRGEGGQNAMTSDFEDALGLLRTQELLAADRYTGVDQFFGTEVDFGFSKTKEEAFAKWTHQRVLYDVVRAIRIYRPLVLTSTWIGGVTDGHGQHQVSGQIAQEAFLAAGDPKIFPELTAEGILPWQPLKIYARVPMQSISDRGLFDYATGQYMPAKFTNYVTGEVTTTVPSTDVIVHEGTKDPLLTYGGARALDLFGKVNPDTELSYVQFARIGLGLQKSQVSPHERQAPQGSYDVAYHLYGSCLPGSPTRHLCHLTDPSSNLSSQPSSAHSTSNLSSRPESAHFADAAERPASPPASTPISAPSGDSPNFFDGIDTSIEGLANFVPNSPPQYRQMFQDLAASINRCSENFSLSHPENSASYLSSALHETDMLLMIVKLNPIPDSAKANILHDLTLKRVQINNALALALGIKFEADASKENFIAGDDIAVQTQLHHAEITQPTVREWLQNSHQENSADETASDDAGILEQTRLSHHDLHAAPSLTAQIERPYFTRSNIEQPYYDLLVPALRLAPATPPALTAWADVTFGAEHVLVGRVVDAGTKPVTIVPPVNLSLSPHAALMVRWREPGTVVEATIQLLQPTPTPPIVGLTIPSGWKTLQTYPQKDGTADFLVDAPSGTNRRSGSVAAFVTLPGGAKYTEGYRAVGYPGLVPTNMYMPAEELLVPAEIHLPKGYPRIGYLPGTGDTIPEAIKSLGLNAATTLSVSDLTPTKLADFDTVILGVRAYAAHTDLHGAPTQALLHFARNGGNVIVQYQTPEFTAADAPYPLSLGSNEKVVDETAPVRLPEDHEYGERLLVIPNKITPADFDGWVEERGHGFLSSWDSHYSAPTETHDPGQDPQRGGIITTPLGPISGKQGRWTYVAFALYRQLPEAVPGAFRLFANLLDN